MFFKPEKREAGREEWEMEVGGEGVEEGEAIDIPCTG